MEKVLPLTEAEKGVDWIRARAHLQCILSLFTEPVAGEGGPAQRSSEQHARYNVIETGCFRGGGKTVCCSIIRL